MEMGQDFGWEVLCGHQWRVARDLRYAVSGRAQSKRCAYIRFTGFAGSVQARPAMDRENDRQWRAPKLCGPQ